MKSVLSIAVFALSISEPTFADELQFLAAARCDVTRGTFALVPVVETTPENLGVPAPPGYVTFKTKANQHVNCKLGNVTVHLVISLWEPQARGMGQGAGVIIIESLSIDRNAVLPPRTNFLWQVANERVLTRIEVRRDNGGYKTQYCYSDRFTWKPENPFENMKCEPTPLDDFGRPWNG